MAFLWAMQRGVRDTGRVQVGLEIYGGGEQEWGGVG